MNSTSNLKNYRFLVKISKAHYRTWGFFDKSSRLVNFGNLQATQIEIESNLQQLDGIGCGGLLVFDLLVGLVQVIRVLYDLLNL